MMQPQHRSKPGLLLKAETKIGNDRNQVSASLLKSGEEAGKGRNIRFRGSGRAKGSS
jgi:hypothetical protein